MPKGLDLFTENSEKTFLGMSLTATMKYLQEVNPEKQHEVVMSSMVFPHTASLKHCTPHESVTYRCGNPADPGSCNFREALQAIKNSAELKALRSDKVCEIIVEDIEKFPNDYIPQAMDGFRIHRAGQALVDLKREGCKGDEGQMGFIEYNDLRAAALQAAQQEKFLLDLKALARPSVGCPLM